MRRISRWCLRGCVTSGTKSLEPFLKLIRGKAFSPGSHYGKNIMKRLLCSSLIIIEILLLSTSANPSKTLATQNPLVALGFHLCGNDPCFLDIIPGKTRWLDLKVSIQGQGFTEDTFYFDKDFPIQGGIHIEREPDKPDVMNSVSFSDYGQIYKITLDNILDLYGYP